MYRSVLAMLFASVLLLGGCAAGQQTVPKEKSGQEADMDGAAFDRSDEEITYMDTTDNVIYLAGGCFWGMEQLMQSIPGVIDAESGYANGTCEADADYKTVCKGETGFREAVRVEYDPEQVSLDALLLAYFYVIDPTVQNRQGNDRGSQYQTGVYFTNESARETVKRIAEIERGRSEKFFVEIGPLKNYYPAEEYHQNYLEKNPNGYGAAFSALRQKYGDRPPPRSLFRHPFSSLFQSSERPAFTPPPYPPDDPHICAAGQNSEKRYRYGSERQLLRHHPSAAPASGKRQFQRKGAAEGSGTDRRGQRRGHYDFSLIFFIFQ